MQHRFTLEPYKGKSSRYHCPECGSREKTFVRYIDTETGTHLAEHVGKCDRLNKCAYHYTPKQFFADNPGLRQPGATDYSKARLLPKRATITPQETPLSLIPKELLIKSIKPETPISETAKGNTLIAFLISTFGAEVAARLIERYFVGTSKHWGKATVFWQIDTQHRVRAGKIIQYRWEPGDTFTGYDCKRVKENTPAVQWVHKAAKLEGFNLSQCLFGEHLLSLEPYKPVGLVESEKTAIVASAYLPGFLWLATGGLEGLSAGRCKPLTGRDVVLFPDLKGLEKWEEKRRELSTFCRCSISVLLESKASEEDRAAGLDLADFLLREAPPTAARNLETTDAKEHPEMLQDVTKMEVTPAADTFPELWQETAVNDSENLTKLHIEEPQQHPTLTAFTDAAGRLFIETPPHRQTFTVYPSIADYNARRGTLEFIMRAEANKHLLFPVTIDFETLTARPAKSALRHINGGM